MVIKVYVSTISFSQEVKKNQQRTLMILESKNIPFVTIDITSPDEEDSKDYMNQNATPKGNNKVPMTPQVFNEAEYCGDFEDLDMANECDTLGEFLKLTDEQRAQMKIGITSLGNDPTEPKKEKLTNGVTTSREGSQEKQAPPPEEIKEPEETPKEDVPAVVEDAPVETAIEEAPVEPTTIDIEGEDKTNTENEVNEDIVPEGEEEEEEEEEEEVEEEKEVRLGDNVDEEVEVSSAHRRKSQPDGVNPAA